MTPQQYTSALTTLSLTPDQAAIWLGIGRSTAYRYLKTGCEGPVAGMLRMGVAIMTAERHDAHYSEDGYLIDVDKVWDGDYLRHSDLTAAVGLPG